VTNDYTLGTGNRLVSWGTNGSALYDTAGNTTNLVFHDGRGLDLQWYEKYQLTSVSSVSSAVEYSYDILGRRISRFVVPPSGGSPSAVEHYVYDGHQVVADLDGNGDITRSYTWGPGIDNLLALTIHPPAPNTENVTPKTYFALKDHLNSVLALADENGNISESYEYDAWGNVLSIKDGSGTVLSQSEIGNRYLFQGREYDFTTGLYYFRARWYSPETGRWLSKDPIGIAGGLNLHVFCENNSVNFVDPWGLDNFSLNGLGGYDPGGAGYGQNAPPPGVDSFGNVSGGGQFENMVVAGAQANAIGLGVTAVVGGGSAALSSAAGWMQSPLTTAANFVTEGVSVSAGFPKGVAVITAGALLLSNCGNAPAGTSVSSGAKSSGSGGSSGGKK